MPKFTVMVRRTEEWTKDEIVEARDEATARDIARGRNSQSQVYHDDWKAAHVSVTTDWAAAAAESEPT